MGIKNIRPERKEQRKANQKRGLTGINLSAKGDAKTGPWRPPWRFISSSAGAMSAHEVDEALEQIGGVVGTGPSFRVILDRKGRPMAMPEAFQATVVEIEVG